MVRSLVRTLVVGNLYNPKNELQKRSGGLNIGESAGTHVRLCTIKVYKSFGAG